MTELLSRLISLLPDSPGVYLMHDAEDKIIYIGKAKSLKKRVSQYFLRPQVGKVAAMVSHVHHFETIRVNSDKEAFILEMNLIQSHHPRYNIMLMDDSHYPYIALHKGNDPHLKIARNKNDRHYEYYGPYPSSYSATQVIGLLNKIFPTRKCRHIPDKPCLYYSLGQCLAPCINKISEEKAKELSFSIRRFLSGDASKEKAELRERMEKYSEDLEYENAKSCKDMLDAIDHVLSSQRVEFKDLPSADFMAYSEREGHLGLAILSYRHGCLLGKKTHVVTAFLSPEEQLEDLIEQYYASHELPSTLVIGLETMKDSLESTFAPDLKVVVPKEGRLREVLGIAELNAKSALDEFFLSSRLEDDNVALLEQLGRLLGIKTPYRIELFDNSHLQGSEAVGAMVCYINGEREKKMYRKFRLSDEVAGDDYHSMVEVAYRRYSRLKEEGASYPDLILTDGGITQVRAAKQGLQQADVDVPVFGLRKNDRHQTDALVDDDNNVFPLDQSSPLFFLLMRMQDEVHRFAISFHKQKRGKAMFSSIFDGISGLGAKRIEQLNRVYQSKEALLSASMLELSQILPSDVAKRLYEKLHP